MVEKAKRPEVLPGETIRKHTGCGHLYVTVTRKDGLPFEVFGALGKSGACTKCLMEGLTRCITLGLRYGVPLEDYVKQLRNLACPLPVWDKGVLYKSCVDAIARVLERQLDFDSLNHEFDSEEGSGNNYVSRITQAHKVNRSESSR